MAKLTVFAQKLIASVEDRVISGLLLPFGEPGKTNLGKLTASAASRLDLADLVSLNVEHKAADVVGKAVAIETTPEGLRASFRVIETPAGDTALLEAAEGLRACLSIEIEPIVTRQGAIVSGTVTGAALVARPAFPSAKLAASEVEDLGDAAEIVEDLIDVTINGESLENVEKVEIGDHMVEITVTEVTPEDEPKDEPLAASAPKTTRVFNRTLLPTKKKATMDKNKLFAALSEYGTTRMEAALSDIVPANTPGVGVNQPAYVGELWDGVEYERKYIDAFSHAELTSWNVKGWKWNNKPVVAAYSGNKAEVASNAISVVEVPGVLQRFAGAWDVDRIYVDFADAEFWDAFFKAQAESYAKVTDEYVRGIVRQVPTSGNGQRVHLLNAQMPANVPTALAQIVKGAVKMLSDLNTLPTHAYVVASQWEPILYTPVTDVLTYIDAALGIKGGTLSGEGFRIIPVPDGSLTATGGGGFTGTTMVCHKNAISIRELGGGAPIRVNALDVAKGGTDEAVFGYLGTLVEEEKGIILYDAPTAS